jgi:hypothetical protein
VLHKGEYREGDHYFETECIGRLDIGGQAEVPGADEKQSHRFRNHENAEHDRHDRAMRKALQSFAEMAMIVIRFRACTSS